MTLSSADLSCVGSDKLPDAGDRMEPCYVVDWRGIAHAVVVAEDMSKGISQYRAIERAKTLIYALLRDEYSQEGFRDHDHPLLQGLQEDFDRHLTCGCGRIHLIPLRVYDGIVSVALPGREQEQA